MALAAKHESHPQFLRVSNSVNDALQIVARKFGVSRDDLERQSARLDRGVDALVGALLNAMDEGKTKKAMLDAMEGE